jgi:hypothetical protein
VTREEQQQTKIRLTAADSSLIRTIHEVKEDISGVKAILIMATTAVAAIKISVFNRP